MKIEGKKLGIRTNGTLRRNKYDEKFYKQTPILVNSEEIPISLNKHKNWELLKDQNIKKYKIHNNENLKLEDYSKIKTINAEKTRGDIIPVIEIKKVIDYSKEIENNQILSKNVYSITNESHIILPFKKNEYPLFRESGKNYETACPTCFVSDGRMWQLKGLGNKSKNKTKGMKKDIKLELDLYY